MVPAHAGSVASALRRDTRQATSPPRRARDRRTPRASGSNGCWIAVEISERNAPLPRLGEQRRRRRRSTSRGGRARARRPRRPATGRAPAAPCASSAARHGRGDVRPRQRLSSTGRSVRAGRIGATVLRGARVLRRSSRTGRRPVLASASSTGRPPDAGDAFTSSRRPACCRHRPVSGARPRRATGLDRARPRSPSAARRRASFGDHVGHRRVRARARSASGASAASAASICSEPRRPPRAGSGSPRRRTLRRASSAARSAAKRASSR